MAAATDAADTTADAVASDSFSSVLMGTPITSLIIEAAADDEDALTNDEIIAAIARIDWSKLVRNIGPEVLRRNNATVQDLQQQVVLLSAENTTMRANIAAAADAAAAARTAAAALLTPSQEQQPWSGGPSSEDDSKVFDEDVEPSEATKERVYWNERSVQPALGVSSHNAKLEQVIVNIDGTPVSEQMLHGIRADGKLITCSDLADLAGKTLRELNRDRAQKARVMAGAKKLASKWKVLRICSGLWKPKVVIAHSLRNDNARMKAKAAGSTPTSNVQPPAGSSSSIPATSTPGPTAESPSKAAADRRTAAHASTAARTALRSALNALQPRQSDTDGMQVATASANAPQVAGDDAEPAPPTQPIAELGPFQQPNNSESRTGDGEEDGVDAESTPEAVPNPIPAEIDTTPTAAPIPGPGVDLEIVEAASLRVILTNRRIAFEKGAKGKRLRHTLVAAAKDHPVTAEEVAAAAIEVKAAALQARATRKKNKEAAGEKRASSIPGSSNPDTE
ncbi:hypothetical protein OC844_004331 [Tilletia horrida]|nr:hypothetical protein OC844_004331 [Tilletia horrida]